MVGEAYNPQSALYSISLYSCVLALCVLSLCGCVYEIIRRKRKSLKVDTEPGAAFLMYMTIFDMYSFLSHHSLVLYLKKIFCNLNKIAFLFSCCLAIIVPLLYTFICIVFSCCSCFPFSIILFVIILSRCFSEAVLLLITFIYRIWFHSLSLTLFLNLISPTKCKF